MTNTLTITVRDKSGVNMGAVMSDLGQGLFRHPAWVRS